MTDYEIAWQLFRLPIASTQAFTQILRDFCVDSRRDHAKFVDIKFAGHKSSFLDVLPIFSNGELIAFVPKIISVNWKFLTASRLPDVLASKLASLDVNLI